MQRRFPTLVLSLLVLLQTAAALVVSSTETKAQWTAIRQFPYAVTTVYFLDKAGSASTGFTGLFDGEIWKTTDRGLTWFKVAGLPWHINCFVFKDALFGWCACQTGLYKTTDGGLSWSSESLGGSPTKYCVGYCASSGVVCAVAFDYSFSSTDLGTTWRPINTGSPSLHISVEFSGLNGVINGVAGAPEYYTTDGGITWIIGGSSLSEECWALHALSATDFVCASEMGFILVPGYAVYESTDAGQTWSPITVFSTTQPTGCILGSLSALFMQTNAGFLTSTDRGHSWFSICGPKNLGDTRFHAIGNEIWAGDWNGWLWYIKDASHLQPLNVTILPDSFHLDGKRCSFTDSTFRIQYTASCPPILEQAIVITGLESFSLRNLPLPRSVNGPDTLPIRYSPSASLQDTGSIDLVFKIGEKIFDTIVKLSGTGTATAAYSMASALPMGKIAACSVRDTSFIIRNLSCDTLTITSASLGDPLHFQLGSPTLPAKIVPFGFLAVHVLGSSNSAGTYQDILKLHLQSGLTVAIDTVVPVSLTVFQNSRIPWTPLTVAIGGACKSLDTVVAIPNLLCDSLRFTAISISDGSYFHPSFPPLPMELAGGDTLRIPVHINAGTIGSHAATVSFSYNLNGVKKDTTLSLAATVYQPSPSIALDSTRMQFGNVGIGCEEGVQSIHFRNPLCDSVELIAINTIPADSEYTVGAGIVPLRLAASAKDSLLLHFNPNHVGVRSSVLMLTFKSDGVVYDTTIAITGKGFSTFHDSILNATLAFDTVHQCQTRTLTAHLINSGCGDMIVERATVLGTGGYSLPGMTFPTTLKAIDTLPISVAFNPLSTGTSSDSVILELRSAGDTTIHTETLLLRGYSVASAPAVDVHTILSFLGIPPCQSLDTSLAISNPSSCDTLLIESCVVTGDSSLQIDSSLTFPIVLAPLTTTFIPIRLRPQGGTSGTANLHLRGPGLDTTLLIHFSALPGGEHWALSNVNPNFIARPCQLSTEDVQLSNDGCDSVTIFKIALDGQSQFAIQDSLRFPLGLRIGAHARFSVHFVPVAAGMDSATLRVTPVGGGPDRTIMLHGNALPIPKARFILVDADGSNAFASGAGTSVQVLLKTLDPIPDSLLLRTLICQVLYNGSLLTFTQAVPISGWNVITASEQSPGVLNLKLGWNGGAISAGGSLASLYFSVTVGDSITSRIQLSTLRLNDDDSSYERCTIQSMELNPLQFTLLDDCASPLLRTELNGKLLFFTVVQDAPSNAPQFHLKLLRPAHISLDISNVLGLKVKTLFDEDRMAGSYNRQWDGRDDRGENVPPGMYYYRLQSSEGFKLSGSLLILR